MLSNIHDKLGSAGLVVAIIALIAALSGTAIAAKKFITKQEAIKIAKKYAGKDGVPGAQGSQGAQGPKGDPGAAGVAGQNGISPTGSNFSGEKGGCKEGGVEIKGANTTFVCNGKPGPTDTKLQPGQTLRGRWQVQANSNPLGLALVTISFPLSVGLSPNLHFMAVGAEPTEECPGTEESPAAAPEMLCLYAKNVIGLEGAPSTIGAEGQFGWTGSWSIESGAEVGLSWGTWAVRGQ